MNFLVSKFKKSTKIKILKNKIFEIFYFLNDFIIKFQLVLVSLINPKKVKSTKFLILTASDTSHFKSLCQLINSLIKYCPNDNLVIYDLGLKPREIEFIKNKYNNAVIKYFDFSLYPSFINLSEKDAGAYAWKPIIIHNERKISNKPILWMDAGNLVFKKIEFLKRYVLWNYFYSPYSSDNLKRWTYTSTLNKLNVDRKFYNKRNLNAALIGFDNHVSSNNIILKWKELALQQDIIIPDGSNKSNHRWDQSLLTILFYKNLNYKLKAKTYKSWGVKIHQDID